MIYIGIYSAAKAYQKLLDYEYQLVIVKNRNTEPIELTLYFDKKEFHHLCGLHKLNDIEAVRTENREDIFDKIIQGVYTDSMFSNSEKFDTIAERVSCVELLENILDDKNTVFKFNNHVNKYSQIEADFIIKNESNSLRYYYFISQSDERAKGHYFGRSCFSRTQSERDYAIGHTTYNVLYKAKVNLKTKEKEELFIAPSYKKELESHEISHTSEKSNNIHKIEFDKFPDISQNGAISISGIPTFPSRSFSGFMKKLKKLGHKITQSLASKSQKSQPVQPHSKNDVKQTAKSTQKEETVQSEKKEPAIVTATSTCHTEKEKPQMPQTSIATLHKIARKVSQEPPKEPPKDKKRSHNID